MNRKMVLIVEDEKMNQKLFNDLIEIAGYQAVIANNGEEGIKLAREKKPKLILMDIQMPVMNGYEAIKILKSDPATKAIPTIALTAAAMKGDEKTILDLGYDGYISKPIDTKAFIQTVKKYLRD